MGTPGGGGIIPGGGSPCIGPIPGGGMKKLCPGGGPCGGKLKKLFRSTSPGCGRGGRAPGRPGMAGTPPSGAVAVDVSCFACDLPHRMVSFFPLRA